VGGAVIRVLIVDDSATVRQHLRTALTADPELLIVGEAGDGERAVALCAELRPDVVTMDMMLPKLSGLAATEHIMAECPTPILVVSSADRQELFSMYDALAAGAVDVLEKPLGNVSSAGWDVRLCAAVRMVSRIRVIKHPRANLDGRWRTPAVVAVPVADSGLQVVVVGASTGGPGALTELLRSLPAGFRTPVLCVQHIAASEPFAVAFSDWLGDQTRRDVSYARDAMAVHDLAGRVLLAPPDRHIYLRDGKVRLSDGPPRFSCRPSVDVLFESAADSYGAAAAGCLLTGMGRDGAEGLLRMRSKGAVTYAQDEASSTVYGMPREAALIGAAAFVLPPAQIAARIAQLRTASEARR
jgi:two-component system chemotaxis response regulator CheB